MLVLQPEEVPDEPPEDLERRHDGGEEVQVHARDLLQSGRDGPREPEPHGQRGGDNEEVINVGKSQD